MVSGVRAAVQFLLSTISWSCIQAMHIWRSSCSPASVTDAVNFQMMSEMACETVCMDTLGRVRAGVASDQDSSYILADMAWGNSCQAADTAMCGGQFNCSYNKSEVIGLPWHSTCVLVSLASVHLAAAAAAQAIVVVVAAMVATAVLVAVRASIVKAVRTAVAAASILAFAAAAVQMHSMVGGSFQLAAPAAPYEALSPDV